MGRPDPLLVLFKDQDFMPLLPPRADIAPLQLVMKAGKSLRPLGELRDAMTAGGAPLPPVAADIVTAANIEGQRSSKVSLNIGLELLGSVLQALAGAKFDVAAPYKKAKSLMFEFAGVTLDKIDLLKLDAFLGQASVNPAMRNLQEKLKGGEAGVISATLKSRKMVVSAQDEFGTEIKVDAAAVKGVTGGKLEIAAANSTGTKLVYEGARPVAFAAQAVQLFFDDQGAFSAFDPYETGDYAVRGDAKDGPKKRAMLTVQGAFAEWKEGS